MLLTFLFLISCIITARLLEKKKMRVASIAYSVLFIILFAVLFLTVDLEPITRALTNVMGAEMYLQTKSALLYAIGSAGYGTCIISAMLLTFIIQLVLPIALAVTGLVRILFKKKEEHTSKKEKYKRARIQYGIFVQKQINLIYCRMLN